MQEIIKKLLIALLLMFICFAIADTFAILSAAKGTNTFLYSNTTDRVKL
jgi:hypothetical protein